MTSPSRFAVVAGLSLLLALLVGAVLSACSDDKPPLAGAGSAAATHPSAAACHAGLEGCACTDESAKAPCGSVVRLDGDYKTCSEGYATCVQGAWSACAGDHVVVSSVKTASLGAGGIHFQSVTSACTDPCDPYCQQVTAAPADVDAAGTVATDAGVSLQGTLGSGDAGPSNCKGLQCNVAVCGGNSSSTTLSGIVFDPAGRVPLYNAFVYVPLDPDLTKLPALSDAAVSGVTCDTCSGTSISAVAVAQTGPDGAFTVRGVPAGSNIPLVVQMGKWRRVIVLSTINACQQNSIANNCTATDKGLCIARLPRNHTDGYDPVANSYSGKADMPQIAMVSGSADPFECMLLKAGIDPNEFGSTTRNSDRRFHFYASPDAPGAYLDPLYGDQVTGDTVWNDASRLRKYDAVILACEGSAIDKKTGRAKPPTGVSPYKNLIDYANAGGRVFASHYSYVWLQYPKVKDSLPDWTSVATWTHTTGTTNTQDPLTSTVVTSGFPKGQALSQWLVNVNASTTAGSLNINEGRQDLTTVGASTQSWMTATDTAVSPSSNFTPNFSFNTPYASANSCGRVIFSDFHVSAAALVDSAPACTSDVDCGFGAACVGATTVVGTCSEPCASDSECADTSYACVGAVPGACAMKTPCTKNSQCKQGVCVSGSCRCTADSQCGSGTCAIPNGATSGTCAPKACVSATECGAIETCTGTAGACTKACTDSIQCGGGEICSGGKCQGCTSSSQCTTRRLAVKCNGGSAVTGTCFLPDGTLNVSTSLFPESCRNGRLSPQEKALEFMFFDLTACVTPDTIVPTLPMTYSAATFTQDYTASCNTGTHPRWREVDWQATIPSTASIDFAAQSGPTAAGLLPTTPVSVAHATASTALPAFDVGYIDTGSGGTGAFNKASPTVASDAVLRLTATLNPTTNQQATPTLATWKVLYSCVPSE